MRWMPNDIAIHYYMPSIHAARLLDQEERPTACRNGFAQLAGDLHYQFDFISYLQVEEGLLNAPQGRPGWKVLILPCALAVSEKEAAEIKKFAEAGGLVIADADCGRFDDRCDESVQPLKGLFDTAAAGVVKKTGKGGTVYLGKTIEWYPDKRLEAEGVALAAEMDRLLAGAGAKRPFKVCLTDDGSLLPRSEPFYLTNGTFNCLGILKENLGGKHYRTPDGVEYFVPFDDETPKPMEKVRVALGGTWHVYDVRSRTYLGNVETLEATITSAEAKLFTLLPYQVQAVEVQLSAKARPGQTLDAAVRLVTDGTAATHVFSVKVFGPEGTRINCYDRNIIAPAGTAAFQLPLALNAAAGAWKVVVRDVASGVEAAIPVTVNAD
jgi:hypothetical protein